MKILVTGCQRSGTRFYAQYLAQKNDIPYIDEDDYDVRDYAQLRELLGSMTSWCVHGPALKGRVKAFAKHYPDAKIIWMARDEAETVDSMGRIRWHRSALIELEVLIGLMRSELIVDSLWTTIYKAVCGLSERLGVIYETHRLVTVTFMEELEHIEGFKKHGDTDSNIGE
jgi:hypothetical protein